MSRFHCQLLPFSRSKCTYYFKKSLLEIDCILFAFVQVRKGVGGVSTRASRVVDGQGESVLGHRLLGPSLKESPTHVFTPQLISRSPVESVFPLAWEILFQI